MTSKIEWTEETWNPTTGCTKVSSGCKNCYAETFAKRLQSIGTKGYENGFKLTIHYDRVTKPLSRKKPTVYFVNSMSDLFHKDIPFSFIDNVFETVSRTPWHRYQILTKRPEVMKTYCSTRKSVPANVILGVSVEDKKALHRIDVLKKINAKRFLSLEPLLEDLGETIDFKGIDWVIVGGESGTSARPMKKVWVERIRKHCRNLSIAFFFKQWGTYGEDGIKRNKKANGRVLSHRIYSAVPQFMR